MKQDEFQENMSQLWSSYEDTVSWEDNLFDLGCIDSLKMIEVILHIEKIIHKKIPIDTIDPLNFITLKDMYNSYVAVNNEK